MTFHEVYGATASAAFHVSTRHLLKSFRASEPQTSGMVMLRHRLILRISLPDAQHTGPWLTNISSLPTHDIAVLSPQHHYHDTHTKVLGVIWDTVKDAIKLKTRVPTSDRLSKGPLL
uniref:DUF5641 domain-containing protein n=1 Tax=Ascaris lumbricoides TaxID=6252 RepID=A0A0M3IC92_ASCLU